ncbi:HAD superfamily hydrolase (TIGR01509 family) [Microbacteriaceae bacterium SG_E_30_P1]|uniref:HAD superfamily hydrolase (TIGR01509 family) n=1 Tax=Antiquaquibacter oligotrophicus TaxID=2880260 RepID=A0ABT6KM93_9MICO|nr:HAD-IA family hydrolase [Antiquaquibacter oligotrophicus]MDH6180548.1 HAD superfamily hydrolase (TIGR01509 family) [Antiquaquibacter oligotrophicus]UDF13718.1 HAD-IA family hydrolase [Antiquaquibacter oligotrophicus]
MDYYFFDLDKTLYAYDFRRRLPALAELTGSSQYHLARSWWADGYEARAEVGEWGTADEYLDHFALVTHTRRLSLEEWASARARAMTRIDGSVAALRRASQLGAVSLLSNNPAATAAALPLLVPDVIEILGGNVLVSSSLGAKKPDELAYLRALGAYGIESKDAFFADDSAANCAGAAAVGITAHHFTQLNGVYQTDALLTAIEEFAAR